MGDGWIHGGMSRLYEIDGWSGINGVGLDGKDGWNRWDE